MHQRLLAILIVPVFGLAAGDFGRAQAPPREAPWFGVALPPALDAHRPVVDVAAVAPPPALVPAGEEGAAQLAGARIRRDVDAIVGFSRQSRADGDWVWGRVTGFPAAARTMTWVAEQFTRAGLSQVQVQEYDATGPMWWATSWRCGSWAMPGSARARRTWCSNRRFPRAARRFRAGR